MEETVLTAATEELPPHLEELLRRASRDALSGLLNRDTMEREIRRRLGTLSPDDTCALFILDLDNFKQVNDTFGHRAGDRAIREAAQVLSGIFRANDIVGRLGGDEFAVFLTGPGITEELLHRKAAQICETLQLAVGDNGAVNLTTSVGVCLADGGQTFEDLYQSADLALYRAKKTGKHRYCLRSSGRYGDKDPAESRTIGAIPLNQLLETMASGVALVEMDPQPQVIYLSPSFCRLIGADPDDCPVPRPLAAMVHPDDLCAFEQALQDGLRADHPVEHTHRVAAADGRWLWFLVRAERINYDNPRPVLLVTGSDITACKERERRLEEANRRLSVAFDQVAQQMWEVDLAARTFCFYGPGQREASDAIPFPEGMIEAGWVHPNSAEAFRGFARALGSGQTQGYGNFLLRLHPADAYRWAALSYQLLYDEAGRAVRAVGVTECLTSVAQARRPDLPWQGIPTALVADLMTEMRLNLTRDTVEALWTEGRDRTAAYAGASACTMLQEQQPTLRRARDAGDADDVETCFSITRMRAQFAAGRRWLVAAYQRADAAGNICRVRELLHLTENPDTGDLMAFGCVVQLHLPAAWERGLIREGGVIDPLTRLYDGASIARAARAFAAEGAGPRAVAVFQTLGVSVSPGDDPAPACRIRQGIAGVLSAALGGGCLLAHYAPDQMVVLFPQHHPREALQRWFEEAFAFLRMMLQEEIPCHTLRFVVGVAMQQTDAEPYETLLNRALCLCGLCWNAPHDMVAFSQAGEHSLPIPPQAPGPGDRLTTARPDARRPLDGEEKAVALRCMAAMLGAKNLETSIGGVLQAIGGYCTADRVYILSLAQGGRAVSMPYEWTGPGKTGIRQAVSGLPRSRFPLLDRCQKEKAPVFLTRSGPAPHPAPPEPPNIWQFAVFPLPWEDRIENFLCIENARRHATDTALIQAIVPYLVQEPARFRQDDGLSGHVGRLMGMPDLRAYLDAIKTLDSAHYTALGAICLDVPGMAAINGSRGFAYGNRLLWYACQAMSDVFGPALLFRTWEAEFVAFLPNTTQQVFAGRCGRLRSILQRRYPRDLRLGCAWADGDFTGRQLVEAARRGMAPEQVAVPPGLQDLQLAPSGGPGALLAGGGQAVVYFQPVIDLRTGRLAGVEALARGLDPDGRLIPPDDFLPALEAQGSVRELDLFVLNSALDQIDRWRAEGRGVLPVAVNLSRVTLRSPSVLASILAIQSRYPAVPAGALELEITEQADVLEPDEMRSLIEQFHSFGLRVSLDDFGARYANLALFTGLPFDTVKLDRSLVADLAENPVDQRLVQDLVELCRLRGIDCLAEGVETAAQAQLLRDAGCTRAQGFFYNPPLPAARLAQIYLRPDSSGADNPSERGNPR